MAAKHLNFEFFWKHSVPGDRYCPSNYPKRAVSPKKMHVTMIGDTVLLGWLLLPYLTIYIRVQRASKEYGDRKLARGPKQGDTSESYAILTMLADWVLILFGFSNQCVIMQIMMWFGTFAIAALFKGVS